MAFELELAEITAEVLRKSIKHVHLSVHPPDGKVRISAPVRMSIDTLREFASSKLGWIRKQQKKFRMQERIIPGEFPDRESHHVWGKRYLFEVIESKTTPAVELNHNKMTVHVRPGTTQSESREIVENWNREELRRAVPALIELWSSILGVTVERLFVRRMKTRWGTCNPRTRSIRLNTELVKKSPECLEYVVLHEMVHLIEPSHNRRFVSLMDQYMPHWRQQRSVLNQLPVRHEQWKY